MNNQIFEDIAAVGIVPLIVMNEAADAAALAQALCEGQIPVAEVTFRTAAAREVMYEMAKSCPQLLLGAGTVHSIEQARMTLDCGGKFVITPGLNPKVVDWCLIHELPVCPGTVTPSDLEVALDFGLSLVKFFPAEAYGGVKTLKALKGPYAQLKFIPTGGVNLGNLKDYLSLENVAAAGGSFVPDEKQLSARDFAGISASCQALQKQVQNIRSARAA